MDYSFIRKIVHNISDIEAKKIYEICLEKGIEVFVEKNMEYHNLSIENLAEYKELYVSAADYEYTKSLVKDLGLVEYLCSESESSESIEKNAVELAEEEFYRKHKQNQMFAWGVIVLVIIFLVFQFVNV